MRQKSRMLFGILMETPTGIIMSMETNESQYPSHYRDKRYLDYCGDAYKEPTLPYNEQAVCPKLDVYKRQTIYSIVACQMQVITIGWYSVRNLWIESEIGVGR